MSETKKILAPFENAESDFDLKLAQGRLRRAIRRGELDEKTVQDAAKILKDEAKKAVVLGALEGSKKASSLDGWDVSAHRANLSEIIGNRHGERRILLGIYKALIDLLEK